MLVDRQAKVSEPIRAALATALHPVEYALRQPLEVAGGLIDYFRHQSTFISEQAALKQSLLELSLGKPLPPPEVLMLEIIALQRTDLNRYNGEKQYLCP